MVRAAPRRLVRLQAEPKARRGHQLGPHPLRLLRHPALGVRAPSAGLCRMPGEELNRRWRRTSPARDRDGWREQEAKAPGMQPGGKPVPGSGSGTSASRKGDSTGDLFLVSCKTTDQAALRLERAWLEEIESQARNVGKRPALMFGFDRVGRHGRVDYFAMPEPVQRRLIAVWAAVASGNFDEAQRQAELLA